MDTEHVKQRLLDRVEPRIGLRIVPKHLFEGRLGPEERLYVCIADYEELRGASLGDAVEIVYGGRHRNEAKIQDIYGRWVNLQLGAFVEKEPEEISAYPEYYVLKLDLGVGNDLDLFPGTWKAMSYILSDRERMLSALSAYDEFMKIVRGMKPLGQARKEAVDFYDFGETHFVLHPPSLPTSRAPGLPAPLRKNLCCNPRVLGRSCPLAPLTENC